MSDTSKTILLAGGGTGGHLYPGIAVASALVGLDPTIRPVFLCTMREIDRTILAPTGFEFIPQPIVPPHRNIGGLLKFWKSWRETKDLVRHILQTDKPMAAIGLGGYAAGVAIKLAAQGGISTAILNPDVIPGKANQYLLRYVSAVCCQFEATLTRIPSDKRDKCHVTGCPIRQDIAHLPDREPAKGRLGLDPRLQTLVVTGASQGATTVNEAVLEALKDQKFQGWQVLHLSGKDHASAVRTAYRELEVSARVIDFTPDMADVWASADLAISRSGASSCAELAACGIPSVLMPYPFHNDMHQRANAKVLADAGAAILMDDEKDRRKNGPKLRPILQSLLYDLPRRQAMSAAARSLSKPDAAKAVASLVTRMVANGR
jgi:UDP-N-acetylglucosamine--N-acetylmuramyl-(pentapeptide) pyrophosphoryl-undecaprenol N-acetylglucosamine transferase